MGLIDIHIYNKDFEYKVLSQLKLINEKLNKMPTKKDFEDLNQLMTDAVANIEADIRNLTSQINPGGLTAEEASDIKNKFSDLADKLAKVASITPDTPGPGESV